MTLLLRKRDLVAAERARAAGEHDFRVRRQVLVTVEMLVSARDTDMAAAISDLVLEDLGVGAECARVISAVAHGSPVVEPGGSDLAPAIGRAKAVLP